nr:uncharacterized protein LOC126531424 [Dermacentor andersoni]
MARNMRVTEPMTFLGVWLSSSEEVNNFLAEVVNMQHVTTIILQTHLSVAYRSNESCLSLPISLLTGSPGLPTFEIAEQAASALHAQENKFRVVFSSTLGVMTYVGYPFSKEPVVPFQPCRQAFMGSIDITCKDAAPLATKSLVKLQSYAYISFEFGTFPFFGTYETEETLVEKLNMYIEHVSDGWALFEVDRDSWLVCGYKKEDDYPRLSAVQQRARLRQAVNASTKSP